MLAAVMVIGSVVTSLLPSVAAAQPPAAQTAAAQPPPTGQILISVVKTHGQGCRPRTTTAAVSPDNTAFTVTYSEYLVQVGVGAKPADARKDCRISVKLVVPHGYTYAIAQADYRGFAHLERGAVGQESASFHFQGSAETEPVAHSFRGPFDDNWQATDRVDSRHLVYAPCAHNRHLEIRTELSVTAGTSDTGSTTSLMNMDSTDGSIDTKYHLAWKRCP